MVRVLLYFFFFFQAEDGIRDLTVTGVQTCALPISFEHRTTVDWEALAADYDLIREAIERVIPGFENYNARSEERRVGKSVDLGGRRIIKKKNIKTKNIAQTRTTPQHTPQEQHSVSE